MKQEQCSPGASGTRIGKPIRLVRTWLVPILILLICQACNLPARQPVTGLIFPTQQGVTALPSLAASDTPIPSTPGEFLPTASPQPFLEPSQSPYPAWGQQTATPGMGEPAGQLIPGTGTALPPLTYITQPGDTLAALAARFGVTPEQISPSQSTARRLSVQWLLRWTIASLIGRPSRSVSAAVLRR